MQEKMVCPKCGFEQPPSGACLKCGIVISKFRKDPPTKRERDQIEYSLEQSLDRYFTTSVKEDEQAALIIFQRTLKRYLLVMGTAFLVCLTGVALVCYSSLGPGFYIGLCLAPGGVLAGIVGSFLVYRCPVCGLFLWLSPKPPGYTGHAGNRGLQVYPPPDACPDCKQPLK
jgi:hypothetical protein